LKIFYNFNLIIIILPALLACKGSNDQVLSSSNEPLNEDYYSLETCETSIGPGVPEFYSKFFKCVTINMSESGQYINIYFNGTPPYLSWYYPVDDPNYTPWYSLGDN